jgi:hypothetical protein
LRGGCVGVGGDGGGDGDGDGDGDGGDFRDRHLGACGFSRNGSKTATSAERPQIYA